VRAAAPRAVRLLGRLQRHEPHDRRSAGTRRLAPLAGERVTDRHLVSATAAAMRMRVPKWIHDQRMPAGAITLLTGREGIGKSTIAYNFTAQLTRGILPGKYYGRPTDVAVVATEDGWEEVILPRLVAAGADLERVHRVEARDDDGRPDTLSVPLDVDGLAELTTQLGIVLLVLDPLMSVIHGGLDVHKDREVRRALDPLSRFASNSGVSVLGLIHVNKSTGTDPLNTVMGSRAFTAVARSVLYCLTDPEAEQEDRFLLGHVKSNLGPKQPTLVYGIEPVKIEIDDPAGGVILTSRVRWDGVDGRSIRDALETPRPERAVGELATRIQEWIADQGRTVSAAELAAEFADVKRATLDQNLRRLVSRGTLTRPVHGHYVLTRRSDARSDTPSIPSEVSEVSEASVDLVRSDGTDGTDGLTGVRTASELAVVA
jgi:hypothetical protein